MGIKYSVTWTDHSNANHSGWKMKYSSQKGAKAEVKFEGNTIKLYGHKSPSREKMKVTIDVSKTYTIDLYNSTNAYKQKVLDANNLSK